MISKFDIYLASQSPRRSELLTQIGVSFEILNVDVDESIKENEPAENYVVRLAKEKANAGWHSQQNNDKPVLGSDTAVVINGQILGKPVDHEAAKRMLRLLSGQTHQVMTAVVLIKAVANSPEPELISDVSVSDVTFKTLSEPDIEKYVLSGECDDKAGAYAIQGHAAAYITHLSGSYSGVMGLPLYETAELLTKAGISTEFVVVSSA